MFDWCRQPKFDPRLPPPQDEYDRQILGDIATIGWSVIGIAPDNPVIDAPY